MSPWAWLAIIAIGCGHPAAPASPKRGRGAVPDAGVAASRPLEDDLPQLAARMARLYRDWSQLFAEAGTDCAIASARMNALVDANADLSEASRRVLRAGHAKVAAFRVEREKYDAEIDAAAKAIFESPTLAACKTDPTFSSALGRLGDDR